MDHLTLLAHLFQAYRNKDDEYAQQLQAAYPDMFAEVVGLIFQAETKQKFDELLEDLNK